ncbi:hypothetical protein Mapa_016493 [Marchantia paleacea]|nr:hypothetical protein Mapa_016493 [Marchantia paleacea]
MADKFLHLPLNLSKRKSSDITHMYYGCIRQTRVVYKRRQNPDPRAGASQAFSTAAASCREPCSPYAFHWTTLRIEVMSGCAGAIPSLFMEFGEVFGGRNVLPGTKRSMDGSVQLLLPLYRL